MDNGYFDDIENYRKLFVLPDRSFSFIFYVADVSAMLDGITRHNGDLINELKYHYAASLFNLNSTYLFNHHNSSPWESLYKYEAPVKNPLEFLADIDKSLVDIGIRGEFHCYFSSWNDVILLNSFLSRYPDYMSDDVSSYLKESMSKIDTILASVTSRSDPFKKSFLKWRFNHYKLNYMFEYAKSSDRDILPIIDVDWSNFHCPELNMGDL